MRPWAAHPVFIVRNIAFLDWKGELFLFWQRYFRLRLTVP